MAGLAFRGLGGEADYPLLLALTIGSLQADGIATERSLEDIAHYCAPSDRFDPSRDVVIASVAGTQGQRSSVIGYSRVGWHTGLKDIRLYYQWSYLPQEWRGQGLWQAMVQQNERRLTDIALSHPVAPQRFFQAWATDKEAEWMSVLESEGYQAVRHFHNMLHHLDAIPERSLPVGLEVRPVQQEHLRDIWEVQKEISHELFEVVAENWAEKTYQTWLKHPSHEPQLWQVAWDGDLIAGMVLNRTEHSERKRGFTEHIFVRRAWRKRGLASGLISRSLQVLEAHGMNEVELGVDHENESNAFGLYQSLGYKTFSIDTWFRKSMDINAGSA